MNTSATPPSYNFDPDKRVMDYGYGLNDIQNARDRLGRQDTLGKFNIKKNFQQKARALPGAFNKRGMMDSGLYQRGREMQAADKELQLGSLEANRLEAQTQLDQQRQQLEESLYWGMASDDINDALRRFGLAQTIKGLV
jgi:hypothetical protein